MSLVYIDMSGNGVNVLAEKIDGTLVPCKFYDKNRFGSQFSCPDVSAKALVIKNSNVLICSMKLSGLVQNLYWKNWSEWSNCHRTCGIGFSQRTRECHGKNDDNICTGNQSNI